MHFARALAPNLMVMAYIKNWVYLVLGTKGKKCYLLIYQH
jgi:hypothetical protein